MTSFGTRHETFTIPIENMRQVLDLLNDAATPDDDGMRVSAARPLVRASAPYATEADVDAQVELGGPINDSAAASIARQFQYEDEPGAFFNQLAAGQSVPVDAILDSIQAELSFTGAPLRRARLEALARWAEEVDE